MQRTTPPSAPAPIPHEKLEQIAQEACNSAFVNVTGYSHASTQIWNSNIINTILQAVIAQPRSTSTNFKYAVNSTIIQHLAPPTSTSTSTSTSTATGTDSVPAPTSAVGASEAGTVDETNPVAGSSADERSTTIPRPGVIPTGTIHRRGMHSATGAYWNNATDGIWSWKYDGGVSKGMDVVVSILWIAC